MDRISSISYVLHQSYNEKMKKIAVDLLNGDLTLREAKQISPLAEAAIKNAENLYKSGQLNTHNIVRFVGEHMKIA
jgi:hypothetical protein